MSINSDDLGSKDRDDDTVGGSALLSKVAIVRIGETDYVSIDQLEQFMAASLPTSAKAGAKIVDGYFDSGYQ